MPTKMEDAASIDTLKRRSCRTRTKVNYKETDAEANSTSKDSDSGSDFEGEEVKKSILKKVSSSDDDIPLQKLKNKRKVVSNKKENNAQKQTSPFKNLSSRTQTDMLDVINSPVKNISSNPNKSISNMCRPNLSEDESSDSEDEETFRKNLRKSFSTPNTLVEGDKTLNGNIVMETLKRPMLFSENDSDNPKKVTKIETLDDMKLDDEQEEQKVVPNGDCKNVNHEPSLSSKLSQMKDESKVDIIESVGLKKDSDEMTATSTTLSSKLSKKKKNDSVVVKIEDDDEVVETKPRKSLSLNKKRIKKEATDSVDSNDEKVSPPLKKKKASKTKADLTEKSKSTKKKQTGKTVKGKTGDDLNNSIEISSESGSESDDNWEDVDEKKVKTPKKSKKKKKNEESDEEDLNIKKPNITIKDIQISVGVESIHAAKKRKSKREKLHIWMRQLAYRIQRETQLLYHKCHLLCLLANAINENELCNDGVLQGICLSLIPKEFFKSTPTEWDVNHVRRFTTWFQNDIPATQQLMLLIDKKAKNLEKLRRIHIYVIMLRTIGFPCRIIYSLLGKHVKELKEGWKTIINWFGNGFKPCTSKVKKTNTVIDLDEDVKKEKTDDKKNKEKEDTKMVTPAKKKVTEKKASEKKKKKTPKEKSSSCLSTEEDPDSDFSVTMSKKTPGSSKQQRKSTKKDKTAVSPKQIETGCNHWAEVYLGTLNKWVCVELATLSINSPNKCEAAATQPLQYVIALDNERKIKDVTCRYAEKWLTVNRKLRADREWWAKTIDPYKPADDTRNTAEDAQLRKGLMQKDLPKTITALKDHPLYVLQRHLLKFQAIYPPDIVPVGFVNKEPVFPRDSVYELHTKETWMKQARSVRPGEIPYKIVKGRPKFNERHLKKDIQSPIFGIWQTEDYVPPPVVDGKVPKNEYGNVELFKASMLPEGAVHLPMANMKVIARQLNIDYAPAMMGWDFHSGFSHPVFEGIVVAKEFEDKLLDEWNKQEEQREVKERLKKEKAIYDNWKKLIKGLLIQARIKSKYSFEEEEEVVDTSKKGANKNKKGKASEKPAPKTKKGVKKEEVVKTEEDVQYTNTSHHWPQMKID